MFVFDQQHLSELIVFKVIYTDDLKTVTFHNPLSLVIELDEKISQAFSVPAEKADFFTKLATHFHHHLNKGRASLETQQIKLSGMVKAMNLIKQNYMKFNANGDAPSNILKITPHFGIRKTDINSTDATSSMLIVDLVEQIERKYPNFTNYHYFLEELHTYLQEKYVRVDGCFHIEAFALVNAMNEVSIMIANKLPFPVLLLSPQSEAPEGSRMVFQPMDRSRYAFHEKNKDEGAVKIQPPEKTCCCC